MIIIRILISNDDGVNGEGLDVLAKVMQNFGEVIVVAPDRERSGHGHSITTKTPLRAKKLSEHDNLTVYSLDGTPVDCVKWALERLYDNNLPDLVISGINRGANVGQDVYYSGTIGAAREASLYGIPAIAISAARDSQEKVHYDWVEEILETLISKLMNIVQNERFIINVNIPAVTLQDVKGIRIVEMSMEHKRFDIMDYQDPKGLPIYWLNSLYQTHSGDSESDHNFVKEGYVTVSPINVISSNKELIELIETKLEKTEE